MEYYELKIGLFNTKEDVKRNLFQINLSILSTDQIEDLIDDIIYYLDEFTIKEYMYHLLDNMSYYEDDEINERNNDKILFFMRHKRLKHILDKIHQEVYQIGV